MEGNGIDDVMMDTYKVDSFSKESSQAVEAAKMIQGNRIEWT